MADEYENYLQQVQASCATCPINRSDVCVSGDILFVEIGGKNGPDIAAILSKAGINTNTDYEGNEKISKKYIAVIIDDKVKDMVNSGEISSFLTIDDVMNKKDF